ncbi:thioester-forming surface-anchored protein [Streptococcus equi]|uniref:Fibronectin-binding protein n=1 Tax=Streptococcus equi subsp. zooepidemicus TaxID=40041 RepID=Q76K20_STRSZ|nr:thioester-forming surface-anchored protein [Streptococcus equi]MDI6035348.1 thioester-forming surface-anchored protein [Streptococcus equi subsp. zooepidemicus]BAD00710.1 fibronectin-binding protein [Streptococcus equi subsp. zooepidemicus]BAJ84560.1 fibronectin-binding protein [Streptococcus equi subsp. zooepidemicus]SQF53409.1 fibronectin-binding protein Fnz [Streptococcus equi subsp. zooepidemicus]
MKTKSFRKVLTTSATCIVLATSFAGGTLRVWADKYYGWNDGTRRDSPFFLYVSPQNDPKRELKDECIVYCFNRDKQWPETWGVNRTFSQVQSEVTFKLPLYEKKKGSDEVFKNNAPRFRGTVKNVTAALVAVLKSGYPTVKSINHLDAEKSRKVTQLAIWYFSDSENDPDTYLQPSEKLTQEEKTAFNSLVEEGKKAGETLSSTGDYTLDIYITTDKNYAQKQYQNLLGSHVIPKKDDTPNLHGSGPKLNGEIGGKTELPNSIGGESRYPNDEKGEAGPPATPQKPNDPLQGLEGGNSPIVEQNYGSTEGYHGQSGILEETEDTNPPGIILGGSGNVETHEDTRNPHLMGIGGGLAGESGETTPKPGQTGGHGPIIEITEDTQKGMSGQSGGTIESENTKKPEVLIGGQGQTIETTEDTQKGMSGNSGGTIESEDTKKPEVLIGGQGQIIDFSENTQSGMSGQSGDTTVIEDTKKSEIIIGGQGQIIDFSEDTQPGMSGQSGGTTIVEDTKKPTPKPKPAPAPIVNDEKPNKGTHLPQTSEFKQLTLSIIGAMSMLLVLCLSLFKRPSKKD